MEKTYKILGANTFECRWRLCSEELPPVPKVDELRKTYLVLGEGGVYALLGWCDGWNCRYGTDGEVRRDAEIKDIIAWMPIPEIGIEEV